MENLNTPDYLGRIKEKIFEHLRHMPAAPGAQIGGSAETAPVPASADAKQDTPKDDESGDKKLAEEPAEARNQDADDAPMPDAASPAPADAHVAKSE